METFDLAYFLGKNIFSDGSQNYLVAFQPMIKYFITTTNG